MSTSELTAAFLCLVAGYWAVSWLMNRGERREDEQSLPPTWPSSPSRPPPPSRPAPKPGGPPWHEVLGVSPQATRAEITAAYRGQISQYHPDKVVQLGPEIRALAERKSAELNAAYDQALKSR